MLIVSLRYRGRCYSKLSVNPSFDYFLTNEFILDVMMLSIIQNNRPGMLCLQAPRPLIRLTIRQQRFFPSLALAYGLVKTLNSIIVSRCCTFFNAELRLHRTANAISWGALAPQMFGPGAPYHMVPISLAIGLVLPLPFWVAVSKLDHFCAPRFLNISVAQVLAKGRFRELQHICHHAGSFGHP